MAIESSPGQKPEREAAPTPPPQTDHEKEQLRREAAEARAQLNQVAEMVQSGRLVLKQQEAQRREEPEDDSALIDRRELKRAVEEIKTTAANVIVETTAHSARQMRTLAKDSLRGKLKNFDKYEHEIDALLEKIPDPRVAANPDTIVQVHKIVRANHLDDEVTETIAEKKREWKEELRAKGYEDDEIEEEIEEREEELREEASEAAPSREGTRPARPVARSSGVAPAGNASGARLAAGRTRAAVPPLSREERVVAEQFGITSAEEYRRYADPNYRHDSFGFHGKKRI